MNKMILLFCAVLSTGVFAQDLPKHYSCSHVKSKNFSAKSASLNQAQIAETKKYDVSYYKLDLAMSDSSTYVNGTGTIQGKTVVTTDSLLFELFSSMTIHNIKLNGNIVSYKRNGSAIKVPINAAPNTAFSVEVRYEGLPPTQATNPMGGAGMTNANAGFVPMKVTYSLSEPYSAYEWFPCKQDLRDKADSVDVFITVKSSLKAGANGVLKNVVNLGNGFSRYEWKHRHPIAYYLISVSVAKYQEYNIYAHPAGFNDSILVQNYIYDAPGVLNYFKNDIDKTADFIELFSDLYGIYPFHNEKYGHCLAPLSGGMEHQTMTTQGFFDDGLTTHELAHQWFGDYVTCASWADIWINEGFASYSEYIMLEFLKSLNQAKADMNERHTDIMSQTYGSVWVADSLNEASIFSGRLTYNKGAAIIHTLRGIIHNDDLFFETLRDFLAAYQNSTATGLDFKAFAENKLNINLTPFFDQWYFGEGYPSYGITWNANNGLNIAISHSTSSPITPLFTGPLEITFQRGTLGDTVVRFDIQSNSQIFNLPALAGVTGIKNVDPMNYIINKVSNIAQGDVLGIDEAAKTFEFSLYPNPAVDFIQLELPEEGLLYQVQIVDHSGKLVYRGSYKNGKIDISKLPAGHYLVQVQQSDVTIARLSFIK